MSTFTLNGSVLSFNVPAVSDKDAPGKPRLYALLCVPLGELLQLARPYTFSDARGTGEQRVQKESHVKTLRKAVGAGEYAVTPLTLGLYDRHRAGLVIEDGVFSLSVDTSKKDNLLPVLDGGHRLAAFALLRSELVGLLAAARDKPEEQAELTERLAALDAAGVPVVLYFTGDTKKDFLVLNLGRAVDRTHMMALTLRAGTANAHLKTARAVAMELNKADGTFFKNVLRFSDTAAPTKGAIIKKVPFNSFCQAGASDLSYSLVGLARVAERFGLDVAAQAALVRRVVRAINCDEAMLDDADYQELTGEDMVLTPLDAGGTLGGAHLYVGMATCLAYAEGVGHPVSDADLIRAALDTMNTEVRGGLDSSRKRTLMGRFARAFFAELQAEKVDDVPLGLALAVGSAAAYAIDRDDFAAAKKASKDANTEDTTETEEAIEQLV